MERDTRVVISVEQSGGPARRGATDTEELRDELERLATPRRGGRQTRFVDVAAVGQIVVALSGVAGGAGAVVETVRAWLQSRAAQRTVRLEIDGDVLEMTGLDDDSQRALIEGWLKRHGAAG